MADYADRGKVIEYSRHAPFDVGYTAPSDASQALVEGIVTFKRRVSACLGDIAYEIVKDVAALPEEQRPTSGLAHDRLIWARRVLERTYPVVTGLELVLHEFDTVALVDLATVSDAAMQTFLASQVDILAAQISLR